MSGYVPNHRPSCQTTMYPTTCRCGMRVFFFSCSCGSAVFFEAPGIPWPIHLCSQRRYDQHRESGMSAEQARYTVAMEQRRQGRTVPERVMESMDRDVKMEAARRVSAKKTIYAEVRPEEEMDFIGSVMTIERNINMPRQFKLQPNRIAQRLLGRLGKGRWHRIGVRGEAEPEQSIVPQVSAFMRGSDLSRTGIHEGQKVLLAVAPYTPPGQLAVWVVTEATSLAGS